MTDPAEAKAINDSGVQNKFGGDWVVGDIKYVNLDDDPNINDGNQTLEDHGDLSIIGNDTPRYNFGFGFNADWNGIDFSMFLQGTMKRDLWLEGPVAFGLGGGQWGSNVWKTHWTAGVRMEVIRIHGYQDSICGAPVRICRNRPVTWTLVLIAA